MPLSKQDSALLNTTGKTISGFFATLAFQTFFYGIYALLITVSIIVHLRKRNMNRASYILFLVTLGMFLTTSLYWGSTLANFLTHVNIVLTDQSQPELKTRLGVGLSDSKIAPNIIENWVAAFNFCASDAVVVWRAWCLSAGSRRVAMVAPVFLLTMTIISSFIFVGYACVTGNPATSPRQWALNFVFAQLTSESLSLLTNISATAVIAWKFWKHRKMTSASIRYQRLTYGAEDILTVLVESGIVYVALQSVLVILTYLFRFSRIDPTLANNVRFALSGYFGTFVTLSGIYPTLIVVLVAIQRSIQETTVWRTGSGAPLNFSGAAMMSGSEKSGRSTPLRGGDSSTHAISFPGSASNAMRAANHYQGGAGSYF